MRDHEGGGTDVTAKDYVRVAARGHALADSNGKSYAHRVGLYDLIGEGPHICHWCKWDGLEWHVDRDDPNYLVPDHLNGDGRDNDPTNLVPAHSWCNNNRAVIERLGLAWNLWEDEPPGERKALYNPRKKAETPYALSLAHLPPLAVPDPPPSPPAGAGTRGRRQPLRGNITPWADVFIVPDHLLDAYPFLAEVRT